MITCQSNIRFLFSFRPLLANQDSFLLAFSTFPTVIRTIAAVLKVIYIGVLCYLLFRKTRGLSSDISSWTPMAKFYIQFICSGIAFLIAYTLFCLGCATNQEYDNSVYCACTINCTTIFVMMSAAFFMSSTIYAYQRLLSVAVGT